MKKIILTIAVVALLFSATSQAAPWSGTGKIIRTLTQGGAFGGCMILVQGTLPAGCGPWFSLDCDSTITPTGAGERAYATALLAASTGVQITVQTDTTKKVGFACLAERVDAIFP